MIAAGAGPEDAGSLVAGALLAGSLPAGALVVTGTPGGGALLVTGSLGGGGALLVTGALELVVTGGGEPTGGPDVDPEDDVPGPLLVGCEGDDGGDDCGDDRGGLDGWEAVDDGGVADPPDGVPDVPDVPLDGPLDVPPDGLPGVPPDVVPDAPPVTLSVTYAPNSRPVPVGGSDAVTRASSGGRCFPAYPTASPWPASRRLASPNPVPARSGTARCFRASKALSCAPVVPTGRSTPRPGSATSTSASRAIFRGAGCTDTTEER